MECPVKHHSRHNNHFGKSHDKIVMTVRSICEQFAKKETAIPLLFQQVEASIILWHKACNEKLSVHLETLQAPTQPLTNEGEKTMFDNISEKIDRDLLYLSIVIGICLFLLHALG